MVVGPVATIAEVKAVLPLSIDVTSVVESGRTNVGLKASLLARPT